MVKLLTFAFLFFILPFSNAEIDWLGNWAFSCDFTDNDLANVRIPGEHCTAKCEATPRCTHFTWTTYNGGTCWMKRGRVTKNDAFSTTDKAMVCGVVERGKPTASPTGIAGITDEAQQQLFELMKKNLILEHESKMDILKLKKQAAKEQISAYKAQAEYYGHGRGKKSTASVNNGL